MKGTADFHSKVEMSLAVSAASNGTGRAIDCLGYDEALAFAGGSLLGGTDPTVDIIWAESDTETGSFVAITNAVHPQLKSNDNDIVTVVNLTNTTLTIAAQPVKPGRLTILIVDTTPSITAGTVTITGTRAPKAGEVGNQTVSEVVSCAAGAGTYRTSTVWITLTSIVTAAFATLGGSGDETIKIGSTNLGNALVQEGRINLNNRKRWLQAQSTVGNSPTGDIFAGLVLMAGGRKPPKRAVGSVFSIQ